MFFFKWFYLGKRKRKRDQIDYGDLLEYDDDYHEVEDNVDDANLEDHQLNVLCPINSQKVYKSIDLENGLSVLVVSDRSASSSSAAMSIRFGSFHDPEDKMGLAHLMEHMLFNGSFEFPEQNGFRDFVNKNSGSVFGFTDTEFSGYSFAMNGSRFQIGLQMFASMFICPLMDVEHLKSEIKTINQEFELFKFKDSERMQQMFAHTCPKDHIFHRFGWGNLQSLSGHEPQIIRDSAMELFGNHFVASCMKLVIVGADPVYKLEAMARKNFSGLRSGPEINLAYSMDDEYKWKHVLWKHGVSYVLESLEGLQCMKITWIIPAVSDSYVLTRPEKLIEHLICDDSQGSLSCFFKSKLWITSLNASVGHQSQFSEVACCSYSSTLAGQLFQISMDITDSGWEHRYDIVSYVYKYFHLLKTIDLSQSLQPHIEVLKSSMRMRFRCLEFDSEQICDPTQFPMVLAVNMLRFPVTNAISLDFDYEFGDEQAIKEMLGNFITKNMRIDMLSKPFPEEGYIEPFFNSKYKEETIPHSYMGEWETSEEIDPALHLPQCNELMPTNFWEVLQGHIEEEDANCSYKLIGDKCFYKDNKKLLSEASLKIYLNIGTGVISHVLFSIFFEMVTEELSSFLLKGDQGYITSRLSYGDDNTIDLKFYGYPQRFKDHISFIWKKFQSFEPTPESFKTITSRMQREFYLDSHDLKEHAAWLLSEAVTEGHFTMEDKFGVMKYVTFDDLKRCLSTLLSEPRIVGVFSGSLSEEYCIQICNLFQPFGNFSIQRKRIRELLPYSTYQVFDKPKIEMETNCLAKVYFKMCCQEESNVFYDDNVIAFLYLFKAMVTERLYSHLRLRQRLGYQVGCDIYKLHGTYGFYFYVVSPDHKLKDLLKMIHAFIATIPYHLGEFDDQTFRHYKDGVVFPDDSGMSLELINEDRVVNGCYSVARLLLAEMEKEDVLKIFHRFFVERPSVIEVCIGSEI